jgi:hypothetical protein
MRNWNDFRGKDVVIQAGGTAYRGRMVEMTAEAILLKAEGGYREIQMDKVTRIELAGADTSSGIRSPSPLSAFTKGTGDKL